MGLRKFLSNALVDAANALEQDQSKEKLQAAIKSGRHKLASWIEPKPEAVRPPII